MPRLPPETINIETKTDGKLCFELSVSVSTSGVFSVSLPESIVETARGFQGECPQYQSLRVTRGRGAKWLVEGGTLRDCVKFVREAAISHYAVETSEECLLVYQYRSGFSYWKNPDGSITHDGGAEDADRSGRWAGERNSTGGEDEPLGLTLQAFAMVKRTHRRGSSATTEWNLWRPVNHHDDGDVRSKLNSISPGSAPDSPEGQWNTWMVIPYTEQAVLFFYRTIHSLCAIDDRMRAFFGDDNKVQGVIQSGGQFLLAQGKMSGSAG